MWGAKPPQTLIAYFQNARRFFVKPFALLLSINEIAVSRGNFCVSSPTYACLIRYGVIPMLPLSTLTFSLMVVFNTQLLSQVTILFRNSKSASIICRISVQHSAQNCLWSLEKIFGTDFVELQIVGQNCVYHANTDTNSFRYHPHRQSTIF